MHTLNKNVYILAICLAALAGCVDAIGFLQLGGYFISFMSGNSTRLAVNLVSGDTSAVTLLAWILCFSTRSSHLPESFLLPSPEILIVSCT